MRLDDGDEYSDDPYEYEYAEQVKRRRHRRVKMRAWRRAQKARMRARAEKIATYIVGGAKSWKDWWVVRHAENLKACSCYMCANRRQYEGPSLQEQRVEYEWKELDDWLDERKHNPHRMFSDEGWEYFEGKLRKPKSPKCLHEE